MVKKNMPFKELYLKDVEQDVSAASPEVLTYLKSIPASKENTFIRVNYRYGDVVLDENVGLKVRVEDQLLSIQHPSFSEKFKARFSYQSIPAGIILNTSAEVYRNIADQEFTFTLAILKKGLNLGIYEKFASSTSFSILAGGRIFMLPKISDIQSHNRLKRKFGTKISAPKHLFDQWSLFKDIAQSNQFKQLWSFDVLFLSKGWFDQKNSKHNLPLEHYLLNQAWYHSRYIREKTIFEFSWYQFWKYLLTKGIKANPYLIQTVRQLIFIANGTLPAFLPTGENQNLAPVQGIQSAYLDEYNLKKYIPTIMQMDYFSLKKPSKPVYYSLQYPSLISDVPNYRGYASVADDLRDLKELVDIFVDLILNDKIHLDNTELKEIFSKIRFDFFHTDMYTYGDICPTEEMPLNDQNLIYYIKNQKDRLFCHRNSFLRGCVRISAK